MTAIQHLDRRKTSWFFLDDYSWLGCGCGVAFVGL